MQAYRLFSGALRTTIGLPAIVLALYCQPGRGDESPPDSWETVLPNNTSLHDCAVIDPAMIAPVPMSQRPQAIEKLENVSILELSDSDASAMLDLGNSAKGASGQARIEAAINALTDRKRSALADPTVSWSSTDNQRLDRLRSIDGSPTPASLKPFLVRGIAKNEGRGAFSATACANELIVRHDSLGHGIPPSIRVPIVIYLDRPRSRVYVSWEIDD